MIPWFRDSLMALYIYSVCLSDRAAENGSGGSLKCLLHYLNIPTTLKVKKGEGGR